MDISKHFLFRKNERNVKACSTESDLRVVKWRRVILLKMLMTSKHCNQCKNMVHSTDWALKVHLAWEEERNLAQEENF